MAYVVRRTTKAGSLSTALRESYRDERGRPRQRLLASLHGEPDPVKALAKLAVMRDALRKERVALQEQLVEAGQFYDVVTQATVEGRQWDAAQRKEIDRLMRARDRLPGRLQRVERDLATIQKDGVAIRKHCTAKPDEIQAAIKAHKEKLYEAECLILGMDYGVRQHKAELRRLKR